MEHQTTKQKAYEYAVFLLSLRLRAEGELREKLKAKNYSQTAIDDVINQLKDQHYIDDQNFAEVYLDNLKKYKSFGFFGIKKKLVEKRLPAEIIENVLKEGLSEEEEMKVAKRFLNRNYESGIMNQAAKQKAARQLATRGFRTGVIGKLVF